jgi:hypothetical protein
MKRLLAGVVDNDNIDELLASPLPARKAPRHSSGVDDDDGGGGAVGSTDVSASIAVASSSSNPHTATSVTTSIASDPNEEEEEEADEDNSPNHPRPLPAASRGRCPYLDTVNRTALDLDALQLCSISLSPLNVYACLVCGKVTILSEIYDFLLALSYNYITFSVSFQII